MLSLAVRVDNALVALAAPPGSGGGGTQLNNPAPEAPAGLEEVAEQWISWAKWGCLVAGALGLLICAGMMAVGRRNRSYLAAEGAAGIPWTVAGLSLAALAVPIAAQIMNATS
ncbi:hypothetical protein Acsp04_63740 [Actinomadura sp. NBRC 104425]|nr:hypothetical protein Acsp04_63740 [Actinomadura sp. NBRC 104425]